MAAVGLAAALLVPPAPASALSIELKDVAPDRIERQRRSHDGKLPLPGTPEVARLTDRLGEKGLKAGAPALIRIFKAQSELELWMEKDGAYVLFATYPICHWSGTLGPKIREGDKQTPEGFYTITSRQIHRMGRWQRALNLGFPNVFDQSQSRNGSYILIHGGCSSVGCFAMTDPGIAEIFQLVSASLRAGQRFVPVHVFPFRMTDANLASHKQSTWAPFWANLKEGFDSFERTKRPPRISVCGERYAIQDAAEPGPQEAGSATPLAVCGQTAARVHILEQSGAFARHNPVLSRLQKASRLKPVLQSLALRSALSLADPSPGSPAAVVGRESGSGASPPAETYAVAGDAGSRYACNIQRPSCRKFVALRNKMSTKSKAAARTMAKKHLAEARATRR